MHPLDARLKRGFVPEAYTPIKNQRPNHDHVGSWDHGLVKSQLDHDRAPLFFDELSERLHTDPLFLMAQDQWGAWPQALYNASQRLGWERVRDTIRHVQTKAGIRNKSAYLFKCLKSLEPTPPQAP